MTNQGHSPDPQRQLSCPAVDLLSTWGRIRAGKTSGHMDHGSIHELSSEVKTSAPLWSSLWTGYTHEVNTQRTHSLTPSDLQYVYAVFLKDQLPLSSLNQMQRAFIIGKLNEVVDNQNN